MINYSISEFLAESGARPGLVYNIPAIHPSASVEIEYYRALISIISGIAKDINDRVISSYQSEYRAGTLLDGVDVSDIDRSLFYSVSQAAITRSRQAEIKVAESLSREAARHTGQFARYVKSITKSDMSTFIRNSDTRAVLKNSISMSAALIKNLSDDALSRVEGAIYRAAVNNTSPKELENELRRQLGISRRRAKNIARDQTSKLNSSLTRLRHEQAGIEEYIWRTSHDERVRPLHRSIDGNVYKWGKPTGAEDGLPPGQPVMCRCSASGIFRV